MPMRLGTPFPGLDGATQWIGADGPPAFEAGKPILVHFWAVSCHICHETLPDLLAYRDRFVPLGLQLVSVHMPRQEADTDVQKVLQDVEEYGIHHAVAVDNEHRIADAYENQYVPAFFLFDREGKLKFRAAGDRGLQNVEKKLEELFSGSAQT
ncbi:MAG: redoxin domain-containing protein [Alicyclobacillaceae bacterium]|nr:redoxin domain-containing protein [Alicyclobacillaceae bacterium]